MIVKPDVKRQRRIGITLVSLIVVLSMFSGIITSCQQEVTPTPQETWTADGTIAAGEYSGNTANGDYSLYWHSDGEHAYFGLRAKATGWVALGFQPEPLHRETDTVIGFIENGNATVLDMYSTGDFGPCTTDTELGGNDDILELGGSEADGYTIIEFKRRLDTGDKYDGKLTTGVNEIIWAYATLDDPRQKHLERGRDEINLE